MWRRQEATPPTAQPSPSFERTRVEPTPSEHHFLGVQRRRLRTSFSRSYAGTVSTKGASLPEAAIGPGLKVGPSNHFGITAIRFGVTGSLRFHANCIS